MIYQAKTNNIFFISPQPDVLFLETEWQDESRVMAGRVKKVLVVEDEPELLEAIKTKLTILGIVVLTARSVKQALDILEQTDDVSVIWLDHFLPGKQTGLDFISRIKRRGSSKRRIPVIVVSNADTLAERQLYSAFGAVRYYPKSNYSLDHIIKDMQRFFN